MPPRRPTPVSVPCARATLAAPRAGPSADRGRPREAQGGCARRPRALEGAPPPDDSIPQTGGCARRLDARPLLYLDAHSCEPAPCAGRAPAGSGTSRPGREDLVELVGACDLELAVAAVARSLVRPPAQEGRGVAKAVALQMIVLDLAHTLDTQRFPREILARA